MCTETYYCEDKEIEVDGYIYRFDGRVDYKYVHSCGHRELVECDNVEITGAIKFNEDEELELDDDEWNMLEETVRENYEDYVE